MQPLKIEIDKTANTPAFCATFSDSLEVGRQREHEIAAPALVELNGRKRLIAAPLTELGISRSHLRIDRIDSNTIEVHNLSKHASLMLGSHSIGPGRSSRVGIPTTIPLGVHNLRVASTIAAGSVLDESQSLQSLMHSLPLTSLSPLSGRTPSREMSLAELQLGQAVPPERIIEWMHQVLTLFKEVAGTEKFYRTALTGLQQMLDLSSAAILFFHEGEWTTETAVFKGDSRPAEETGSTPDDADGGSRFEGWQPSTTILDMVVESRQAFRQLPNEQELLTNSLSQVVSLVAAPIFDDQNKVIGAVYGDRRSGSLSNQGDINEIEGLFVELIASGIATGLARIENEKQSAAARTRFEQFFPPELARRLELDEKLLIGRNCDVTVMFCDIRQFSHVSERIGPEQTVRWINSVMDRLSACVLDHEGVLVDYIGDELLAMWGAPDDQPDHAILACRAALSMLESLPELSDQWRNEIGEDLKVGIGINSGLAQVGNIGSNVKFKYGPLGNTVNIASRIQNATKQLQTAAAVSETTAQRVGDQLAMRRLCQIRVVNVKEPFTVFELAADCSPEFQQAATLYEQGLSAFEAGEYLEACRHLTELLAKFPNDGPAMILLSRAVNRMGGSTDTDTVWNLTRK